MADVEVRRAPLGDACLAHVHGVEDPVIPGCPAVARDEHVVLDDTLGRAARPTVGDLALGEDDRPVMQNVAVESEEVALGVDKLLLCPGRPPVVGLSDPGIAAGRSVPRDVDVSAVVARREHRLVVPRDIAVGLDRRRPRPAVVRRAREHHVEAIEVGGINGAGVRDDLDDRIELPGSLARAKRPLRPPCLPAIRRDVERDVRHRTVAGTGLVHEVGRHQIHERCAGIRRDRRLPVIGHWVDGLLADPARRRRSCGGPLDLPQDAAGVRLRERLEPGVRLLRQLLLDLRTGARWLELIVGPGRPCARTGATPRTRPRPLLPPPPYVD